MPRAAAAALLLLAALPTGGRARLASPPGPDLPPPRNFPPPQPQTSAPEIWLRLEPDHVLSWASAEDDAAADLFDEDYWYDFRPVDSAVGGERRWEVRRPHFQTLATSRCSRRSQSPARGRRQLLPTLAAAAVDARDQWDGSATLGEGEMSEEGDSWRNEDDR